MRRSIRRLTETYLTLSFNQISELVGLGSTAAAERQTRDMIVSGSIHASIDQQKGMVRFLDNPERYDTHETAAMMEKAIGSAISLASRLSELHATLTTDQHYLAKVTNQERQPTWDDDAVLSK
jgi:COP9 signalosome complex subunit 3